MTEKERRKYGPQSYISANVIAAHKPEHFAHLVFNNKFFSKGKYAYGRWKDPRWFSSLMNCTKFAHFVISPVPGL